MSSQYDCQLRIVKLTIVLILPSHLHCKFANMQFAKACQNAIPVQIDIFVHKTERTLILLPHPAIIICGHSMANQPDLMSVSNGSL